MNVIRIVPNLASSDFDASREFYSAMFDLDVSVELGDWYLQMMPPSNPALNIGFAPPGAELFGGRDSPPGVYGVTVTVHVDAVDEAYERARRLDAEILLDIRDEDYGQRHFLVVDPNGVVLNVMSAI